jgi:hypothetical protein
MSGKAGNNRRDLRAGKLEQADQDRKNTLLILAAVVSQYHGGIVVLPENAILQFAGKEVKVDVSTEIGRCIVKVRTEDKAADIITPGDPRFTVPKGIVPGR